MSKTIKIVCISDTHAQTDSKAFPEIPNGDILIHAGDFTLNGQESNIGQFNDWLGTLPHHWKIVIAGNHDKMFDSNLSRNSKEMKKLLTNCFYLEESSVLIEGIRFYGAPFSIKNEFSQNNAFALNTHDLASKWAKIPSDTDIVITHSPPYGINDIGDWGNNDGCKHLLKEVTERIKPKFHVFGHVHPANGRQEIGGTTFINASIGKTNYQTPIVIEYVPTFIKGFI